MKKLICLSLVASSFLLADTDLEQLKAQMDRQQLIIEKLQEKIEKMEYSSTTKEKEYIQKLETITENTKQDKSSKDTQENIPQVKSETFGQSKYMPDISLITDFSYVSRSKKDDNVAHLEVPGVVHGLLGSHSDGGVTHSTYNASNGFNFNYSELALSSAVDPFFTMDAIFHLSEHGFEIEEAFFTSTALSNGLRVKGGKFLSNFGYLNEKHHHAWSFSDMPLVYEGFVGLHGINEIGLQLQWVAPTSTYLMFGAEILQGDNEQMFGTDTIGDVEAPIAQGSSAPSLFVAYAKSSIDIDDTTILGGISYANGSSRLDHSTEEAPYVFSGDSELYGIDLLVKQYFDSYSYLSLQSEVLYREMDGKEYTLDPNDTAVITGTANLNKKQAGLYTQLEYAINRNWKTALRYDTIYQNDVVSDGINLNEPDSLNKYSAMVEYRTSEFAKFRLQYNRNEALFNEDGLRQKIDTIIFQINIAIGAHGAHEF